MRRFILLSFFILTVQSNQLFGQKEITQILLDPIVTQAYHDPTGDKPQSKYWHGLNRDWLVINDKSGPKIYSYSHPSWQEQSEINQALTGLPGKGDVYSNGRKAWIILTRDCQLTFVELSPKSNQKEYQVSHTTALPIPQGCQSIETVSLTRDSKDRFWVASDFNEEVLVWHSEDGITWSQPLSLAKDITPDDISLIVHHKKAVSVLWSNQKTESIMERYRQDQDPLTQWSAAQPVEQGNKNADDHLNATTFRNGTVAVVTKNSVDIVNQPQFVFRYRDKKGQWTNIPYEILLETEQPTRPIINHVKGGKIYAIHSSRDKENNEYFISINEVQSVNKSWLFTEVAQIRTRTKGRNGDVTSSKAPFNKNHTQWIFFSDDLGHVFAYDLQNLNP